MKENIIIFSDFTCASISSSENSTKFPKNLKPAEIQHPFTKMLQFFNNLYSKYQCGFRKSFSTQRCLLGMLEKWEKSVCNGKAFRALLTNLAKAFDCVDHELLIAKLNANGFSLFALKLIHDYPENMKQRTEIN